MKYVAGPRSLIWTKPASSAALESAVAAAQRLVVVVDGDGAVGLLLEPDLEAAEAGLFGVRRAVGPGVVVEDEDADLAERQRVVVALLGQVDARGEGAVGGGVVGQRDVLAPHLVVERADRDQVSPGRQVDGACGPGRPRRTIGLLLSVVTYVGNGSSAGASQACERVVDVDDVVEVRQRGAGREVARVHRDRAAGGRT